MQREYIQREIRERRSLTSLHIWVPSLGAKGLVDVSEGPRRLPRSRLFDLAGCSCLAGRKNKDFSKDLPDSYLPALSICFFALRSSVERSYSSRLEIYGERCTRRRELSYHDSLKHFSFFFSFIFLVFVSDVRLSRFPLFSFVGGRRPQGMLHVPRFIFSFAPSPSAYFGESFCISNSNSCKDSTCPTAARRCEAFSMPHEQFR